MAVNETENHEPLYPKNHPYSSASAVGAPDEQDLLQAEVLELRGRTARAELRVEVLTRAAKDVVEADRAMSLPGTTQGERTARYGRLNWAISRLVKALDGGGA